MPIPEQQLNDWSQQGSVTNSSNTYKHIREAMDRYQWPEGVRQEVYLQGSYANTTNIRGESDVDVVVECNSMYYSNLSDSEKQRLGLNSVDYSNARFRADVIAALRAYCTTSEIDDGGPNAIAVHPNDTSNRLKADVLPCTEYRVYRLLEHKGTGICFWKQNSGTQIVNFPKLHKLNGERKNAQGRTSERYKPSVRMFKNARRKIIGDNDELRRRFPSYFMECLLYNVPDNLFDANPALTFRNVLVFWRDAFNGSIQADFVTQNGQSKLFGESDVQWSQPAATELNNKLMRLWNDWS